MKLFSGLSGTARVMLSCLGVLFLAFLLAGLLVAMLLYPFERPAAYALGLLVGSLLSAAKIVLLDKSINRTVDLQGKQAQNYGSLQSLLRYGLTILVFVAAVAFKDVLGVFGIVIGVLLLQLSAYAGNAVLGKRPELL